MLSADVLVIGLEHDGEVKLCTGINKSKDQSYFLFATTTGAKHFGLTISEKSVKIYASFLKGIVKNTKLLI